MSWFERRMAKRTATGKWTTRQGGADPHQQKIAVSDLRRVMGTWSAERRVLATEVRNVITGMGSMDVGLRLHDVAVEGPLDLRFLRIPNLVHFRRCHFLGGVVASSSRIATLRFENCLVDPFNSKTPLRIDHSVSDELSIVDSLMESSSADVALDLKDSQIDVMNLHGTSIDAQRAVAVDCTRLRARRVVDISQGFTASGGSVDGAVVFQGADIGHLDATGARIINFQGVALDLARARIHRALFLRGSKLDCAHAAGESERASAQASGAFVAVGRGEEGAVRLRNTRVGGRINMAGAYLENQSGGSALNADGLSVDQDVYMQDRFRAVGGSKDLATISLREAVIGGDLSLATAYLSNDHGPALRARSIRVSGSMKCNDGFQAIGYGGEGAVDLRYGRIEEVLTFATASISGVDGPALLADGLVVDQDLKFFESTWPKRSFTATSIGAKVQDPVARSGAVCLIRAKVGGQFNLRLANITCAFGPALQAYGLHVGQDVFLDDQLVVSGGPFQSSKSQPVIQLSWATFDSRLALPLATADEKDKEDNKRDKKHCRCDKHITRGAAAGSPTQYPVGMDGLTYGSLGNLNSQWQHVLHLIDRAPDYAPQPYQQLAQALRVAGHDSQAREVLMTQRMAQIKYERKERRTARPPDSVTRHVRLRVRGFLTDVWLLMIQSFTGHGYRPKRLLWLPVIFGLLAGALVWSTQDGLASRQGATTTSSSQSGSVGPDPASASVSPSAAKTSPLSLPVPHQTTAPRAQMEGQSAEQALRSCGAMQKGLVVLTILVPLVRGIAEPACTPTPYGKGPILVLGAFVLQTLCWLLGAISITVIARAALRE